MCGIFDSTLIVLYIAMKKGRWLMSWEQVLNNQWIPEWKWRETRYLGHFNSLQHQAYILQKCMISFYLIRYCTPVLRWATHSVFTFKYNTLPSWSSQQRVSLGCPHASRVRWFLAQINAIIRGCGYSINIIHFISIAQWYFSIAVSRLGIGFNYVRDEICLNELNEVDEKKKN